jgi:glycosyltransferase involved in cell wall biosynthesis
MTAFPTLGLEYLWRRRRAKSPSELTNAFLWAGTELCRRTLQTGLPCATAIYAFNSAALELLVYAKKYGLTGIVEQTMAPARVEDNILVEEEQRFPGWEPPRLANVRTGQFCDREAAEWENASLIICGSQFVADGVRQCGGPADRCRVVPYGFNPVWLRKSRMETRRPIRILVAGTVSLRKGAPYVLQAAKLLAGRAEFKMIGPIKVLDPARAEYAQRVELLGSIPSSDMRTHYEWADVFVLPSLCEGSATVCYEALSAGLPVITTRNSGSVVRNGVDGFILPIRDGEGIATCIDLLLQNADLYRAMSAAAVERSTQFSLDHYGVRLLEALEVGEGRVDSTALTEEPRDLISNAATTISHTA